MQSAAKTTEFRPDELVDFVLENEFFLFSFLESRVGENFENGNRTFPLSFIFLFFFPFLFCSRNQEEDRTKDNEARDNEDE